MIVVCLSLTCLLVVLSFGDLLCFSVVSARFSIVGCEFVGLIYGGSLRATWVGCWVERCLAFVLLGVRARCVCCFVFG